MSREVQPVTLGCVESSRLDCTKFAVHHVFFAANSVLPPHTHDRANLAVIVDGSFESRLRHGYHSCAASSVLLEPLGARHDNHFEKRGARVVVVQPDPQCEEFLEPLRGLFSEHRRLRHEAIATRAREVAREMLRLDDVSPMIVEGLVLEMIALGVRTVSGRLAPRETPGWLVRGEEFVRAEFRKASLSTSRVADEVGVHPVHLARVFRAHFGVTVGQYVRRLRVDWAIEQITGTDQPLASIAQLAGFSDQSHLTRSVQRATGCTPGQLRRRR